MKYFISIILLISLLVGCSPQRIKADIVVSSYPLEYIVKQIVGNEYRVYNVLPANADPHEFELSQTSLTVAQNAKIVFYVADSFDPYLANIDHSVSIYDQLQNIEDNPHFWLSPKQMIKASEVVYNYLVAEYKNNTSEFRSNYNQLLKALLKLDNTYKASLADTRLDSFIISHDSFKHLQDYQIGTIPLTNESHSDNTSQQELVEVIEYIKANEIKYIANEPTFNCESCQLLTNETTVEVLTLNPLASNITNSDYVSEMKLNLVVIEQLLS